MCIVSAIDGWFSESRDGVQGGGAGSVKMFRPPRASVWVSLHCFRDGDTSAEREHFGEALKIPGLENFIDRDVNASALGRCVCIGIDNVSILDQIAEISRESNE
jgi:hypothetical protein